jgi:hypothetical protein
MNIPIQTIMNVLSPFGIIGIIVIISKMMDKFLVKIGYVKVNIMKSNFRTRHGMARPKSNKLKIGGKDVDYNNKPGFVWFDGDVPNIFYHEGSIAPINMLDKKEKMPVDEDHWSNLLVGAFKLGELMAMKDDKKNQLLLLIAAMASIASVAVMLFLVLPKLGG